MRSKEEMFIEMLKDENLYETFIALLKTRQKTMTIEKWMKKNKPKYWINAAFIWPKALYGKFKQLHLVWLRYLRNLEDEYIS